MLQKRKASYPAEGRGLRGSLPEEPEPMPVRINTCVHGRVAGDRITQNCFQAALMGQGIEKGHDREAFRLQSVKEDADDRFHDFHS